MRELARYLAKLMLIGSIIGAMVGYILAEGLPEGAPAGAFTGAMIGLSIVALRIENRRIAWKYRRRRYQSRQGRQCQSVIPLPRSERINGR